MGGLREGRRRHSSRVIAWYLTFHDQKPKAEQAGATHRLLAASQERHDNHHLNLEPDAALPVACGKSLTFCNESETPVANESIGIQCSLG